MRATRSIQVFVIVFCAATVGLGCESEAALSNARELNQQLETSAKEQNETLAALSKELQECKVELAGVTKTAAVIKEESAVEIPVLAGDENLATLGAHKDALKTIVDDQKGKITQATDDKAQCAKDLDAARSKARAKKRTPKAVKIQEAKGKPTTGAGSRYKKR